MEHLEKRVGDHYDTENLLGRIDAGLAELGLAGTDPDDLKPVDEFHAGGIAATEALLSQLDIGPQTRVVDIGAGLGGTARYVARRYGAHVTGVDITPSYVEVAKVLNARCGLDGAVTMMRGSALDMPLPGSSADLALMFHVGMNIEDKPRLMAEVARVLKPGGTFALYDATRDRDGSGLSFPLPWADGPGTSFVEHRLAYGSAAEGAGLVVVTERDRRDFALGFFEKALAAAKRNGPAPLGIHLLMRGNPAEKLGNYAADIAAHRVTPVEMIFRKGR